MTALLTGFVLAFGSVIGSFLNAVLWRLHSGESIVRGRSLCPSCRHDLSAHDLIPVFSWLFLAGRCRYCRVGISVSYPLIELMTAGLFWLAAWRVWPLAGTAESDTVARLLLDWYLIATLIVVFVFDLRHMLILRSVTVPATVLAAIGSVALGMTPAALALGLVIGGGVFWLQYVVSRGRWIGGGDIHLGLLMGAMLGGARVLLAIMIAYVAGAAYAVVLLATKRATTKTEIPFGTFLSAAAVLMLLYGESILNWYIGLL